ncbi:hypothetical protein BGZ49_003057, partial [Haplosporangium sp. Z 27]
MIISILATLKAGGAYVPLDPSFASDRLRDTLRDAAPVCIVADNSGRDAIGNTTPIGVPILDPNTTLVKSQSNPQVSELTSRHLAYVIYTSGTTGKPKGVMIEHKGVVSLIMSKSNDLAMTSCARFLQFSSFTFDASVYEIFLTLCIGGTLHLVHDAVRLDRLRLWEYLEQHSITHVLLTPTLLQDCKDLSPLSAPVAFIIGGEALPASLVHSLHALLPKCTIINAYGPTETTVVAVAWRFLRSIQDNIVPIGQPIANKRVYILDTNYYPVPLGAVGELYIGGVGVARGYLNRPELTAERFLPDPFAGDNEARMYKTGDLVRYLPDGNIVYLGRNDHQVKIRGFRIELGEIEARLNEHLLVTDSVVIAVGEGANKRLVAYVISKSGDQFDEDKSQLALTLRLYLKKELPEYMVPSAFVRLDAFPLSHNGKLDRRALPAPSNEAFAHQAFEEPQGEVEMALASIWTDLLHIDRVSRHDNFFALGGHSLLAMRMVNRIAILGITMPLSMLFSSPCLSDLAEQITILREQETDILPPIEPISRTETLPLSFAQQRMWFLAQLDDVSDTYHIPLTIYLHGPLNKEALQSAMNDLYERHEALRSVFVNVSGQPQVQILSNEGLPVKYIDLRGTSNIDEHTAELADRDAHESFDLEKGPLIRVTLIQVDDLDHVLILTQHHIISDGWSMAIMTRELSQLYSAYRNGSSNPLTPLTVQYPDYAAWQRQWFSGDRLKDQEEYWRNTLADVPVLIGLPTDHPRPPRQSFAGSHIPINIDVELTSALKRLCQEHGVTLFMTILTAWSIVLSRLSGQDDIVIGTPSANRGHHEIEPLIGLFVNTLALRIDLSGQPTIRDLLEYVRQCTLTAHDNQDLPFEQVVEIIQPPRRMDHTPLFQVMFAWQSNETSVWNLQDLQATNYAIHNPVVKFDLELGLYESDNGIIGSLRYSTALFDPSTISKHVGYLITVLREMTTHVGQPVGAIDILSQDERTLLLETWNMTQEEYPDNLCLHQLFENQVALTPEAVAVVYEDQTLTYSELNERANSLAHQLIQLGVQPDNLVAICVERSLGMIIGILAILKAGGAYVPLDPSFASDRLRDTLRDAVPVCVVADDSGRDAIGDTTPIAVPILDPNTTHVKNQSNPLVPQLTSRHLVYVIYTSGTTGKPKGVMIEHKGVVSLIMSRPKGLNCRDLSPLSAPVTFIIAGEALPASLVHSLHALLPKCTIINGYGPTETTVLAVTWKFVMSIRDNIVPIGQPIANRRVYILDTNYCPVPLGAVGELYIGGVGVARGYLNRPELTAERFLSDPFAGDNEARMYKTGDIVRYLPDGNIVYLGRNDHQVKIRGFRIELGEIEARLNEHPLVADSVVIAVGEDANRRLVAYIISKSGDQFDEDKSQIALILRLYLEKELPEYMVPSAFVQLDALPLTPNGKLDRNALPAPDDNAFAHQTYEQPQGTIEAAISNIWAELLGISKVGRHDNFFMIGGHSLLVMKMTSRIRSVLGFEISLRTIFEAPT